jgi:hypothetical protein
MPARTKPHNAAASWSLGLGLVSMAMVLVFWPASPFAALAGIVCGVRGLRAAENGFGGKNRAIVGIVYGAIALVALGAVLFLFYVSDLA